MYLDDSINDQHLDIPTHLKNHFEKRIHSNQALNSKNEFSNENDLRSPLNDDIEPKSNVRLIYNMFLINQAETKKKLSYFVVCYLSFIKVKLE
jgi:hypothetical protein